MISVGIIGFGRIGAEHAAWLSACRGIRAVATADATPARQELARSRGLRVVSTPEELLNLPGVDAILVATPTAMHFDHASAGLRAGKHVLVEKPMALDHADAAKVVELAASQRRVLSVFHNRRWDIDYLTARHHVQAGTFGRVINVESRLGQWASCVGPAAREYRPGWRNEAAFGGGGLYDWGSHFVDQAWRLLWPAKPVRVFGQLRGNVWTTDCDDFARLLIDFDSGAAALVEINTTTTRPLPRWHIDGTSGSADAPHSPVFSLETWSEFTFTTAGQGGSTRLDRAPAGLTESNIWEQFAAAVRGEGPSAVDAITVLPTMQLLDAARQSSARGCAVDIDTTGWRY